MEATDKTTIVDVKIPGEDAGEHYPDVINIPHNEVAQRIEDLFKKSGK